ncbi:uncharacterized protein EAF01_008906 [Botrytis porri]|uniref:Uncharacterized protein n=1 Tax=Botrytis porri TaxID=87229 RepID=A0A4Z1K875_9HELO|nr:uncharacterized protein EAF01_008906 [Botrytis porri]KAF7897940.1 hypothetical protein EAF01_008906 [Botrytis porri]TGO81860.1 hypothetical protein BPOR_0993g00060 [Botrytis porri]
MALNPLSNTPIIARKFGRTLERIEHLPNACLKYQKVGKVGVTCQFRLSKSKWGVMGEAENPAGVIYMSLGFDQPNDCRLSSATVSITLEDSEPREDTERRSIRKSVSDRLHITDQYGPKQLYGPERRMLVKKNLLLTPNINILGNGGGGVGLDTSKEVILSSRWIFNGRLRPATHPTHKGRHTAIYRTLEWELTESEFEQHTTHSNMIHTAFAFEHDGRPFLMEVNIKGKLKSTKDNILRHLKFSSDQDKSKGSSTTFVHLPRGDRNSTRLDILANSLPRMMEMENLEVVPTEIPDALPASIFMGGITAGTPRERTGEERDGAAIFAGPRQSTLVATSTERITVDSKPMGLGVSNLDPFDPTYPSLENLSRASLILTNTPQSGTGISERHPKNTSVVMSEPVLDLQDGSQSENGSSWFPSDTTVVEEQDAEQLAEEARQAKHKDIQDSLLMLSGSPYLMLILKLLLGLMTVFRETRKTIRKLSSSPESIGKDSTISQD